MTTEVSGASSADGGTAVVAFYTSTPYNGCTLALANVAWILASAGKKVLVVDHNLRKGVKDQRVSRYLQLLADVPLSDARGLTDMICEVRRAVQKAGGVGVRDICRRNADIDQYLVNLLRLSESHGIPRGCIDYLGAGTELFRHDVPVEREEFGNQDAVNWFLEELHKSLRSRGYDYVLVDTRAGEGGVLRRSSMVVLPDIIAWSLPFSPRFHLEAAIDDFKSLRVDMGDTNRSSVVPFAGMVSAGSEVSREAYASIEEEFGLGNLDGEGVLVQIPHTEAFMDRYALAAFVEEPSTPRPCLGQYEKLTALLTGGGVRRAEPLSARAKTAVNNLMRRGSDASGSKVTIVAPSANRVWADWIKVQLAGAGLHVRRADLSSTDRMQEEIDRAEGTVLVVVSQHLARTYALRAAMGIRFRQAQSRGSGLLLAAVHVDATDMPTVLEQPDRGGAGVDAPDQILLAPASEREACNALLGYFGLQPIDGAVEGSVHGPRFPGTPRNQIREIPKRNKFFAGREAHLDQMRSHLRYDGGVVEPIVLLGAHSIGKTQIAREFLHRFMTDYDVVYWISADHPDRVKEEHKRLLDRILPKVSWEGEPPKDLRELLSRMHEDSGRYADWQRWLLVYSDACAPGDLLPQIPGEHLHVVVTSHDQSWEGSADARVVPVRAFRRRESRALFLRRGLELPREMVDAVAERAGHDPLALTRMMEIIWAYRDHGSADVLNGYLDRIGEDPDLLPALRYLGQFQPASLRLLQVCAFLDPNGIPVEVLRSEPARKAYQEVDTKVSEGYYGFGQVLYQAKQFSLLEQEHGGGLYVYPRVQSTVLSLSDDVRNGELREHTHQVLASCAPPDDEMDDRRHDDMYRWLGRQPGPSGALQSTDQEVRRWLVNQVRFHYRISEHASAVALGEQCRSRWQEEFEEEDVLLLRLNTQLANAYRALGRHEEAASLTRQTLARQEKIHGAVHPFTLQTRRGHAADLRLQGMYVQALEMDEAVLLGYQDSDGPDELNVSIARHNLSLSQVGTGDYKGALTASGEAYNVQKELLGPVDPWTLVTQATMGANHRYQGNYAQAETILAQSHQLLAERMGQEDSDTLNTHKELITAQRLQQDGEMSARLPMRMERVHRTHAERYGSDHERSLSMGVELAACLAAAGDHEGACRQARSNLTSYEARFGKEHFFTALVESNLSVYSWLNGDGSAALAAAESAYGKLSENEEVEEGHPLLLGAAINLANARVSDGGELSAVLKTETEAYTELRRRFGDRYPLTQIAQNNYTDTDLRLKGNEEGPPRELRGYVDATVPEI